MSDPDFTRSDGLAAMAPTVQIGGRGYVAGRICLAMMFFIPPDGRFSTPPRMVEALARVGRDLPLDLFEFWEQGEPHQSGVIAKQPPLDPAVALDRFMAENKTSVTGTFWVSAGAASAMARRRRFSWCPGIMTACLSGIRTGILIAATRFR